MEQYKQLKHLKPLTTTIEKQKQKQYKLNKPTHTINKTINTVTKQ